MNPPCSSFRWLPHQVARSLADRSEPIEQGNTNCLLHRHIYIPFLFWNIRCVSQCKSSALNTFYSDGVWQEDAAGYNVNAWENNDHIALVAWIHCWYRVSMELNTHTHTRWGESCSFHLYPNTTFYDWKQTCNSKMRQMNKPLTTGILLKATNVLRTEHTVLKTSLVSSQRSVDSCYTRFLARGHHMLDAFARRNLSAFGGSARP